MPTSSFLADERLCRRRRLRLAPVADVQHHAATSPAATSRATPRRSSACRKTTSTASSVPTRTTSASIANATTLQRPRRLGVVRQDLRREHALQQLRRLQVAGLRHQRPRLHAPRRREEPVELVPVAQLQAGQVRAHAQLQHQPVRRLELRRRPHSIRAATSTRTGRSPTTTASAAASTSTRRRSAIA